VFCHLCGVLVIIVQEHHNPPCKQWLAGLEVDAVSSLSRFALGCISCVEVGRLAVKKVGLQACVNVYHRYPPSQVSWCPSAPSWPQLTASLPILIGRSGFVWLVLGIGHLMMVPIITSNLDLKVQSVS